MLLEATNIKTERLSKKLDDKRYGPFKVIKKEGLASYRLKLDKSWRQIHPVYQDAKISIAQGQEGFESLVGDSPNYRVIWLIIKSKGRRVEY